MNFHDSRVVFSIAFLVMAGTSAHAGNRLGLSAGIVSTSFSITPSAAVQSKTGITLAASIEKEWEGIFSFEAGFGYVPKSFKVSTYQQTSHYLNVPLLVKTKLPTFGPFTPFVAAGPEISYLLGEYYSILIAAVPLNKFDFSFNVSAGIESALIPFVATYIRAGYSTGLLNVVDQVAVPGGSARSKVLALTVGMILPL